MRILALKPETLLRLREVPPNVRLVMGQFSCYGLANYGQAKLCVRFSLIQIHAQILHSTGYPYLLQLTIPKCLSSEVLHHPVILLAD